MRSTKTKFLLFSLPLCFLLGSEQLLATEITTAVEQLNSYKQQQLKIVKQLKDLNKNFKLLTKEIQLLKAEGSGLLNNFRLETKLKQAKAMSEQLSSYQGQLTALANRLQLLRQKLVKQLDSNIDLVADKLLDLKDSKNSQNREQLALKLQKLLKTRQLLATSDKNKQKSQTTIFLPTLDSSQQTDDKLAYYSNRQKTLQKKLAETDRQLALLKRRQLLAKEVTHFLEEESFFSENGFAKIPANSNSRAADENQDFLAKEGEKQAITTATSDSVQAVTNNDQQPATTEEMEPTATGDNSSIAEVSETAQETELSVSNSAEIEQTVSAETVNDSPPDSNIEQLADSTAELNSFINRIETREIADDQDDNLKNNLLSSSYQDSIKRLNNYKKQLNKQLLIIQARLRQFNNNRQDNPS